MDEKLRAIQTLFDEQIAAVKNAADLEAVRVRFLGRKDGLLTAAFKDLGAVPVQDKPAYGKRINELKDRVTNDLDRALHALEAQQHDGGGAADDFDPGLPGLKESLGRMHPLTLVTDEICALFIEMGFNVVEGPEIETEHYNFEALNIPLEHPSRESFDTFYLSKTHLLRSHTSPVQVRYMEKHTPPIQIVVPGTVYRPDATDASHSFMFHQIEGLLIDEGITLGHLKGVLSVFAKKLFGSATKTRFRPHFFPFTEPSAEMDVSCSSCGGKGCSVCKQSGWVEILGSGMVHPAVLSAGGIDSKHYSGFAFGMGVERIAMIKYGINDIRLFFDNDLRFTRQFG